MNQNSTFNPREIFRMFDQDNKGFITEADFAEKFAELEIYANAAKLVNRFDKDGDCSLNYSEFRDMITPLNRLY